MEKLLNRRFARHGMAVVAGLLLTAAFPNWNMAGAAWLAPGLLLFAAMGGKNAFSIGWTAGMVHALTSLVWLLNIPFKTLGMPLLPGLGWIALSAYVALYPALWAWFCWKFVDWNGQTPSLRQFAEKSTLERTFWCLLCGALWVALEMVRFRFLSGFPWNPLGASQYRLLPLIQVASVGGVHSVSFLVAWTSVSIAASVAVMVASRPVRPIDSMSGAFAGSREAFLPILAVGLCVGFGMHKIFDAPKETRSFKAALIQPSIPQTLIWDTNANEVRFQEIMDLSKKALAAKPDLLVWPESGLPQASDTNLAVLFELAKSNHVWIIINADEFEPDSPSSTTGKSYNSAFLISPDGKFAESYRKNRLVIFGEYIPLVRWLPFLKWLMPDGWAEGGFTSGDVATQFLTDSPEVQSSVLICFEDGFPQEARRHTEPGTDVLINLTNDGWFGRGATQWQQAAMAIFRAIENGIPLIRCTNDGVTCWIDSAGRARQIFNAEDIYGTGYLIAEVPLPQAGTRLSTYFNRNGDVFGWACVALAGLRGMRLLAGLRFRRSKTTQPDATV